MPGLRENIESRLSTELIIDNEFAGLIPPLMPEEFSGLEQSIISEGCREAIIVWNNIIVDGHNRYKICRTHNIPYRTEQKDFADRDEVVLWMLRNQLSRRNLSDFQRIEMVSKCEEAVKTQAEKRQKATQFGGGGKISTTVTTSRNKPEQVEKNDFVEKFPQSSKSRDELGAMAGVSGKTYEHATAVLAEAPEPVIDATRHNELSINTAYEVTKLPKEKQAKISERIVKGENPRKVVADIKASSETKKIVLSVAADVLKKLKALAKTQDKDVHALLLQIIDDAVSRADATDL